MGLKLFKLALLQILRNWKVTIRLSWFWILVYLIAEFLISNYVVPNSLRSSGETASSDISIKEHLYFASAVGMSVVVMFYGIMSIAVGWHRFILLDECRTGLIQFRSIGSVAAYWWRSIKIGLIVLAIFYPLSFVGIQIVETLVSFILENFDSMKTFSINAFLTIFNFATATLITWVILRIGLILPAITIDDKMPITDSYGFTAVMNASLIVTAVLIVLLQLIPKILLIVCQTYLFAGQIPDWFAIPVDLILQWLTFFVSVGILTVLYGHLVEDRPL